MRRVLPCLFTLILLAVTPGAAEGPSRPPVREPILAGTWYPASPNALRAMTTDMLAKAAPPQVPGRLVALIAPHAGYVFSGQTAAAAFTLLAGRKFDTVVLVGPSHFASFEGVSVHDQGDFKTPLGVVPLNRVLIAKLAAKAPFIRPLIEAHTREHSLEIELPLLQTAMPGFTLVPLVMGSQDAASSRRLGEILAEVCRGASVLMVASTDLSHFHDEATAGKLDAVFAADVSAFDPGRLAADLAAGNCEACGGGPAAAVMTAARLLGADTSTVLARTTSAQATGDTSRVVGYLAAALSEVQPKSGQAGPGLASAYSPREQQLLRDIARQAIQTSFDRKSFRVPDDLPETLTAKRGAFVTLKIAGELRGCIGLIESDQALAEVVAAMAKAAAFQDPRFSPLRSEELAKVDIEISVMSKPRRIADPAEITVGRDGIIMRRPPRAGLLLPQVATEYGWDRETFLRHTCAKAGLPGDCWKDKTTEISIFSADVF